MSNDLEEVTVSHAQIDDDALDMPAIRKKIVTLKVNNNGLDCRPVYVAMRL
jgi:hypothetical protein